MKERLDKVLVDRALAPSREKAQALIMAGCVRVNGEPATKAGIRVDPAAGLEVTGKDHPYVSRGGVKLEAALHEFQLDPTGWTALDIGASTGGFTHCLLLHGAARVFAVDVGYGQLAWEIRSDPRVTVLERTNIRQLNPDALGAPVDLAVIDVSFISLALVLRHAALFLKPQGYVLGLVKPQFEAGREHVGRGGTVKDPAVHADVLQQVEAAGSAIGLTLQRRMESPIAGKKSGNHEFLVLWQKSGAPADAPLSLRSMDTLNPDYKPLEPRKSQRSRALRRWLQYWAARGVLALTSRLSIPALQQLGRWLGRLAYRLNAKERGVCEYQMAMVMPELPSGERERLIRRCFEHMGMAAVEVLAMPRLRREATRWLTISGEAALRAAHAQGRGIMVVTAHCGNWELLALAADRLRLPMTAVARPLHNERLNAMLLKQRSTEFMEIALRGTASSARALLQALKNGRALIVAIDQDIEAQSVYADFLGKPARTPRVAASLALRMASPVVTVFDERLPDGSHRMHFEAVEIPDAVRQAPDAELALTQLLNDRISAHIRRVPEQWGWNHRRWLHQPGASDAATGTR